MTTPQDNPSFRQILTAGFLGAAVGLIAAQIKARQDEDAYRQELLAAQYPSIALITDWDGQPYWGMHAQEKTAIARALQQCKDDGKLSCGLHFSTGAGGKSCIRYAPMEAGGKRIAALSAKRPQDDQPVNYADFRTYPVTCNY